jgi:iron complex outermembrane recepter protein
MITTKLLLFIFIQNSCIFIYKLFHLQHKFFNMNLYQKKFINSENMFHDRPFRKYIFWLLFITQFLVFEAVSQTTVKGIINDNETNEELIGATVKIVNSTFGCVTDFNGEFTIKTNLKLPFSIEISYIGYESKVVNLTENRFFKLNLVSKNLQLKAVEVLGGISKKLKESPLSIESMDINDIKQTSATNFYEGLSHMKGVDMTSASLGFRVINTRGFNSTSPVRSLQIIDGVDNASPGLNFALGNFLGASELDLMKVEIVSGASSAFFGPNAFNGVISMNTKSPFLFDGLSASVKLGERFMNEYAVRYAKVFKDDKGEDRFAYKLNLFYMNANDWEATNTNSVANLDTDESNPGSYDAVNRYGDENLSPILNNGIYGLNGIPDPKLISDYPGLGRYHRTGYWEKDIVDYDTENFKANAAFHYLFKNKTELIASSNFANGTTVYQGDNRFSLKDIKFFQNKIEIKKDNNFFLRAYATHEDAGDSYDAVLTAFQLQNAATTDEDWDYLYKKYWRDNITNKIRDIDPNINWTPWYDPVTQTGYPADTAAINYLISQPQYVDSLFVWHQQTAEYANTAYTPFENESFYKVGTKRFDSLKNEITSKASVLNGGSKIVDKSALYHLHGEKTWDTDFCKITLGGNGRVYTPKSGGSLFSDTGSNVIINKEYGGYFGIEKKFLSDQLMLKASIRVDKNQNFDFLPTPAVSLIYNIDDNSTVRATFTSAIRNPTLLNQYMYYNVGRAKLVGNINGYDSLVTIESLRTYTYSEFEKDSLEYFSVNPISPEKVKCLDIGYRGVINRKLYVDAGYYFNWYTNFIGFVTGADIFIDPFLRNPYILDVYRIATNSTEKITTQGFSLGINYYLDNQFTINANYSWNKLNQINDDPIIPAYNTPENKFNFGINGKEIDVSLFNIGKISFNTNYKWVQGFIFEGSPQFTGEIPSYGLLDFQVTKQISKLDLAIKLGASNILNNEVIQVYGGPFIGRMAYLSLLFEFKN